ncbi:MAG: hypothetical protein EA339_02990 [Rhodobacteraceae bacterium]|nr:MAG: hypothetical protein EA339_02990 [Paracoccaceae bacterium]
MKRPLAYLTVLIVALAGLLPVTARPAFADELAQALLLPELFEIMATEGRMSVMADGAIPLQGPSLERFEAEVAEIYAPGRMLAAFMHVLDADLQDRPEVREDTLAFAATELGKDILRLEISARKALLDDEVDLFARHALEEARMDTARQAVRERLADIRQRIEANDLIELNVSLGLNTSFAYYRGMMMENAVSGMSADMLLQLVWSQEPDIRADIEDWVESYFLMAYQPLDEDSMQAFLNYVDTPLARAFNQAMFRAFDEVFSEISLNLGRALGRHLAAEDL